MKHNEKSYSMTKFEIPSNLCCKVYLQCILWKCSCFKFYYFKHNKKKRWL